jgi:hypothetical protein
MCLVSLSKPGVYISPEYRSIDANFCFSDTFVLNVSTSICWRVLSVLKIEILVRWSLNPNPPLSRISSSSRNATDRMTSSRNSDPYAQQTYHTQIMNQQEAQALDALQKVVNLEEGIDSNQANGNSNGQAVPVNQNEVCETWIRIVVYPALTAFFQ